jgi:hypothetical protein
MRRSLLLAPLLLVPACATHPHHPQDGSFILLGPGDAVDASAAPAHP